MSYYTITSIRRNQSDKTGVSLSQGKRCNKKRLVKNGAIADGRPSKKTSDNACGFAYSTMLRLEGRSMGDWWVVLWQLRLGAT